MSPLGGFDQVVALTQKHINDNLSSRWKLYKTLQEFEAELDDGDDGSMKATMDPPTVELFVPGEPRKARFVLHLRTGTFTYKAKLDGDTKKTLHSLPMDGWSLAFMTNFSAQALKTVPDELRDNVTFDVREKIEKAGSYSLDQIILDLTTSDILDFDLAFSVMPGINLVKGQDIKQKSALREFMAQYVEGLSNGSHNVLGYAITVKEKELKPEDRPPSLPSPSNCRPCPARPARLLPAPGTSSCSAR